MKYTIAHHKKILEHQDIKKKRSPKLLERENSSLNKGMKNQIALDFTATKLKCREEGEIQSDAFKILSKNGFCLEFLPLPTVIQTWELNIYLQTAKMFTSHTLFLKKF